LGVRVQGVGYRFRVWGTGVRVQGVGYRGEKGWGLTRSETEMSALLESERSRSDVKNPISSGTCLKRCRD